MGLKEKTRGSTFLQLALTDSWLMGDKMTHGGTSEQLPR